MPANGVFESVAARLPIAAAALTSIGRPVAAQADLTMVDGFHGCRRKAGAIERTVEDGQEGLPQVRPRDRRPRGRRRVLDDGMVVRPAVGDHVVDLVVGAISEPQRRTLGPAKELVDGHPEQARNGRRQLRGRRVYPEISVDQPIERDQVVDLVEEPPSRPRGRLAVPRSTTRRKGRGAARRSTSARRGCRSSSPQPPGGPGRLLRTSPPSERGDINPRLRPTCSRRRWAAGAERRDRTSALEGHQ